MKLTRISLVAKNGIERLRRQGIEPDLDDIACLHDYGTRLEHPPGAPSLSVLGDPVKVGNVILWPWSIGAERWFRERAQRWFSAIPEMELYAMAFSFAMSRRPEVLVNLIDARAAAEAIRTWILSASATRQELIDAMDKLLPDPPAPGAKEKLCPECHRPDPAADSAEQDALDLPPVLSDPLFQDLIARLMKAFPGTSMEFWTWSTPEALSLRFLAKFVRQLDGESGSEFAASEHMAATHNFETALRMIRDKHLARRKRAEGPRNDAGSVGTPVSGSTEGGKQCPMN